MFENRSHVIREKRFVRTRENNNEKKNDRAIRRHEYKMKRNWVERLRVKIELLQFALSLELEKLTVFDENRNRKILKKLRKKIIQLEIIIESQFVIVKLCFSDSKKYTSHISNDKQLNFKNKIMIVNDEHDVNILIDTKIFVFFFINDNYVRFHKLSTIIFNKFIKLRLINNDLIFNITHMIQMKFKLTKHVIEIWSFVTKLIHFDMILNMS